VLLANLQTLYKDTQASEDVKVPFQLSLIDQVLDASSSARMRDLPAYFLNSTSLQRSIRKYLALSRIPAIPLREQLTDITSLTNAPLSEITAALL
jgi:hypothetical protein